MRKPIALFILTAIMLTGCTVSNPPAPTIDLIPTPTLVALAAAFRDVGPD